MTHPRPLPRQLPAATPGGLGCCRPNVPHAGLEASRAKREESIWPRYFTMIKVTPFSGGLRETTNHFLTFITPRTRQYSDPSPWHSSFGAESNRQTAAPEWRLPGELQFMAPRKKRRTTKNKQKAQTNNNKKQTTTKTNAQRPELSELRIHCQESDARPPSSDLPSAPTRKEPTGRGLEVSRGRTRWVPEVNMSASLAIGSPSIKLHKQPKLHSFLPSISQKCARVVASTSSSPNRPCRQSQKTGPTSSPAPQTASPKTAPAKLHAPISKKKCPHRNCMPPSTRPPISQIIFPSLLEVRTP